MTTNNTPLADGGGLANDSAEFTGVFINEATIKSARSVSNEDIYKNGKPVDVGIELELEIGQKFYPKVTIAGNLNVAAEDKNKKWGSAMKVKIFLSRMKVQWKSLNADNSIPQAILDQLVDKKIMRLQYPAKRDENGKIQRRTYLEIFPLDWKDKDGRDLKTVIRAKYDADVAAGYVKPLNDENTDFPGAHETVGEETPVGTKPVF